MSILASYVNHSQQRKLKSATQIPELFWREMGMVLSSEIKQKPFFIMR